MRSQFYQNLYPDDLMIKTFGTLTPTTSQKSEYYHTSWRDWSEHAFNYDYKEYSANEVKRILKDLGLRDIFDFLVRPNQVRFRLASDLAVAKLAVLERKVSKL